MNNKWDKRFLRLAQEIATWSKDPSTQVGAIIVRDRRILATGCNGFAAGIPDDLGHYDDRSIKHRIIIHAEENALLQAGKSANGATLYVSTLYPCSHCAALLVNAGIKRIVYQSPGPELAERYADSGYWTRWQCSHANVELVEMKL